MTAKTKPWQCNFSTTTFDIQSIIRSPCFKIVSISCQFLIIDAPYPFFTLAARKKERPFKDFQMLLCLTLGFGGVGEEVQKVNYMFNVLVAALYSLQSCKGVYTVRKLPRFLQYIFWINQYKYTTQAPNLCSLHRVFDFQK